MTSSNDDVTYLLAYCVIQTSLQNILYKFHIIPSYIQRDIRVISELFDPSTYSSLTQESSARRNYVLQYSRLIARDSKLIAGDSK